MARDDEDQPVLVEKPKVLDGLSVTELEEYLKQLHEEIENVKKTISRKKSALSDAAKIFG